MQDEAIPLILGGGDVMVAAETGSGKTGAFVLPALQLVHEARAAAAAAKEEAAVAGASASAAASAAPASPAGDADGGGAAKRSRPLPSLLNVDDRTPLLAVAPDGLTCQCRAENAWGGVRGSKGVKSDASPGKVYYEAAIRDEGLCRFGWASRAASLELGVDKHGYGYGGTGKKSHDRAFTDYGGAFGRGDVVGCMLDVQGGTISFSKNGVPLGVAFPLTKGAGTLYPSICMKNAECGVNFGATPFAHPPPDGFVALDDAPPAWLSAEALPPPPPGPKARPGPMVLILTPARDLAEQTHNHILALKKHMSPAVSASLIIGGVDSRETGRAVEAGSAGGAPWAGGSW